DPRLALMDRREGFELAGERIEQAQGCGHLRARLTRDPSLVKHGGSAQLRHCLETICSLLSCKAPLRSQPVPQEKLPIQEFLERRYASRKPVALSLKAWVEGEERVLSVRDLSQTGFLAEASPPLEIDQELELELPH